MKLEETERIMEHCSSFVALSLNRIDGEGRILKTIRDPLKV